MPSTRPPSALHATSPDPMSSALAKLAGDLLVQARAERPRTTVAEAAGMSDVALLMLERGAKNPTLERLERIGFAYGIRFLLIAVPIESST